MLDILLFGGMALLLGIVIVALVIVMRDHMKSKAFELHLQKEEMPPLRKKEEKAEPKRRPGVQTAPPRPAPTPEKSPAAAEPTPPTDQTPPPQPPSASLTPEEREAREILARDFGPFRHTRLVEEMGLSDEEADEFVVELIHQLEEAIRRLDEAIAAGAFDEVETTTHGLKGAALNIGEGGVAQILIDYNTYMKTGSDPLIVEAYQKRLKESVSQLKVEYSQLA